VYWAAAIGVMAAARPACPRRQIAITRASVTRLGRHRWCFIDQPTNTAGEKRSTTAAHIEPGPPLSTHRVKSAIHLRLGKRNASKLRSSTLGSDGRADLPLTQIGRQSTPSRAALLRGLLPHQSFDPVQDHTSPPSASRSCQTRLAP